MVPYPSRCFTRSRSVRKMGSWKSSGPSATPVLQALMAPAENVRFGGQPQGILINQGFPLRDLGDLPGPDHGPEVGREEGQNVLQQVAASLAGPIPSPVRPGLVHLVAAPPGSP